MRLSREVVLAHRVRGARRRCRRNASVEAHYHDQLFLKASWFWCCLPRLSSVGSKSIGTKQRSVLERRKCLSSRGFYIFFFFFLFFLFFLVVEGENDLELFDFFMFCLCKYEFVQLNSGIELAMKEALLRVGVYSVDNETSHEVNILT